MIVLEQQVENVIQWADDKGIFEKGTDLAQQTKTEEEVAELRLALEAKDRGETMFKNLKGELVNTQVEIKDGLGDSFVTLIIQAERQGLTVSECIQAAYDVISKRKGTMVDGVFIREN